MFVLEYKQLHIVREEQTKIEPAKATVGNRPPSARAGNLLKQSVPPKLAPKNGALTPWGDSAAEN